ncbi:MAG: class I SAM-dependent methyltransferase [Verrucomicrobia bacterium]|nr:class I SAM-dependent methyltransferase [Verrucomicrobiota bacterium]
MIERTRCPISGEPGEVIFSRPYSLPALHAFAGRAGVAEKLTGKSYEVRFCPASGLHFQTWVMDETELAGLYSPPVDEFFFLGEIGTQKLHWFAHMTEEILVMRQMVAGKIPVVLDFGCNWGKWASMALAHGCEVYGVDVNRDAAAFCAARGIKMISFEQMRAMRFDFINVDQVMEHLSDPLGVAQALAGALKPGGFMKLGTPDNPRLPRLLRAAQASGDRAVLDVKTIDSLAPLEHVNLFNHAALRLLGERVGLRAVRLPFFKWMGAGQLWNLPRQFNRNLTTPWKRWRMRGPYLWLQKSSH